MPAMQPGLPGGYPPQAYALPPGQMHPYAGQPAPRPARAAAPRGREASRDPLPPPPPSAVAAAPAPRAVRGVRAEEPVPAAPRRLAIAPLSIPSPEELGVTRAARPTAPTRAVARDLDWTRVRQNLQEMGVSRFQLENTGNGGVRFSCWVGSGSAAQLVQADGSNEAEAVQACLQRASQQPVARR